MGIKYTVGDRITAKKQHPCGGTSWTVVRTGADYKLKCDVCGRVIFLSKDEVDKMAKAVSKQEN